MVGCAPTRRALHLPEGCRYPPKVCRRSLSRLVVATAMRMISTPAADGRLGCLCKADEPPRAPTLNRPSFVHLLPWSRGKANVAAGNRLLCANHRVPSRALTSSQCHSRLPGRVSRLVHTFRLRAARPHRRRPPDRSCPMRQASLGPRRWTAQPAPDCARRLGRFTFLCSDPLSYRRPGHFEYLLLTARLFPMVTELKKDGHRDGDVHVEDLRRRFHFCAPSAWFTLDWTDQH